MQKRPSPPRPFQHAKAKDLAEIESLLKQGHPIHMALKDPFPTGIRASELLPLLDSFSSSDPQFDRCVQTHLPPQARENPEPLSVTAIIPTHRQTPIGLDALRKQDCDVEVLVLLDGGGNAEGDRVERVAWEGHGKTRQRGVEMAQGDYVLFTVDDALPRGSGCVRALVEALEEGEYDAVFGRQIPWPSTDPITKRRLRHWTPPGQEHRRMERLDHVFALYRRETLLKHPLPDVPIGEDLHWRQGRRIGYVPTAPVIHAHPRMARQLFRRTRDLHVQHHALGEQPLVPSAIALALAIPSIVEPLFRAGPQELPNQIAELLGQWRAAKMTRRQPTP